jgi:hypothetical protein
LQYERIDQSFWSAVVISTKPDDSKTSPGVKCARRFVIRRHFEHDALGAPQSGFAAYRVEKSRANSAPPMLRQDAERHDFSFLAKRKSQGKPGKGSFRPPDLAKKPWDAHYLLDCSGVPRIIRKARAVEQGYRADGAARQWLDTRSHVLPRLGFSVMSGGRR